MAVTFVIGNANRMPTSLFSPGTSIASTLANEFGEAADFHLSTLFALGFLLFVITFVVLAIAKIMLLRSEKAKGAVNLLVCYLFVNNQGSTWNSINLCTTGANAPIPWA
jgi:hypothetical protein